MTFLVQKWHKKGQNFTKTDTVQGEINNLKADLEGEGVKSGSILYSVSWLATTKDKSVLQGKD